MQHRSHTSHSSRRMIGGLLTIVVILALSWSGYHGLFAQDGAADGAAAVAVFDAPTTSSPITLSQDKQYIWTVNPDDGSVSVLGDLEANPRLVTTIKNVGREPQAVALDTGNHAYVVSPPDNSVTVIEIRSSNLNTFNAVVQKRLVTGAEPWNLVASPDGQRIFVANSGQDTITVIRTDNQTIVGSVNLRNSACNVGDPNRHFQPRGLAVTLDNQRLYVARFLSFTKPGGVQGDDNGKEGVVCQLNIPADVAQLPTVAQAITLAPQETGFRIDANGDGVADATSAYPNQLQSIVIRDNQAYLPNIAASPSKPLRFNVDTQAFVNVIDSAATGTPVDASAQKFLNLHLGARVPEAGKKRLFFANPWAIGFTTPSGEGNAYVVSAGSDLLVKVNVAADGKLSFTGGVSTTTYIDLNDPDVAATSGDNAGKNPLGIVIRNNKAFVMNNISRNVSVVDLDTDAVERVIRTAELPLAGSFDEQLLVGKEIFFSSRGLFEAPAGQTATVSLEDRLSSEGWQNCGSCHFAGLTDGVVWQFVPGPRKSVPMNGTWSPHNPDDQRLLNYSAFFDEVQDFEINVRNVSGPGALATPINGSNQDPNHGLIISDTNNVNFAPAVINGFALPNAGRPQVLVRLPDSDTTWPALDAMKEWVRFGIRTPEGALTTTELGNTAGALNAADVRAGRRLFFQAQCQTCHGGTKWTVSNKDFVSPPDATEIATEQGAPNNAFGGQFLNRFLSNINSFNLGVAGQGNDLGNNVGAVEVAANGQTGLGQDHNGDGKGNGFNIPSLLAINAVPPYYHNGACETLACVLSNQTHRTGNGQFADVLASPANQAKVVAWLETLDADTPFPANLRIKAHDIFLDPPVALKGQDVTIGANVSLFGTKADLADLLTDLGLANIKARISIETSDGVTEQDVTFTAANFGQDFGQAVISTTVTMPANPASNQVRITVEIDNDDAVPEDKENDNLARRRVRLRNAPTDRTPPEVGTVAISDDSTFNDADPIVTTRNVKVKFTATDPTGSNGAQPSGVTGYCIVSYTYDAVNREWVEEECDFAPLPAPIAADTFVVDAELQARTGVAYAFVWVRDGAGNISKRPGFDVVSYIPTTPISLRRNDVRIFRLPLAAGQSLSLTFTPSFGDVDVSVFDDFTNPDATRIALSANNGDEPEQVTLTGPGRFQVEVRAVVNSEFTVAVATDVVASAASAAPLAPSADGKPLVGGPPARQAAIDDDTNLYLPLINK
ncbi:MAG: hypothetical protein R3E79_00940 [Caldilineaceae bacterium]